MLAEVQKLGSMNWLSQERYLEHTSRAGKHLRTVVSYRGTDSRCRKGHYSQPAEITGGHKGGYEQTCAELGNLHRHTRFYQNCRRKEAKQSINSKLIDFVIEPLPTRKLLDPNAKCKAVKVIENKKHRGKRGFHWDREVCRPKEMVGKKLLGENHFHTFNKLRVLLCS